MVRLFGGGGADGYAIGPLIVMFCIVSSILQSIEIEIGDVCMVVHIAHVS